MYASQVSKDLFNWIQENNKIGQIHSIFKSTVNILSEDGKFIPIINNDKPMSPFSIKLDERIDFRHMDISIGDKILFAGKYLKGENITIFYDITKIWDNSIDLVHNCNSIENFKAKLNIMKDYIGEKGNKEGIFQLLQFIPNGLYVDNKHILDSSQLFIKDRFKEFNQAFTNNNIEEINSLSKKIIGFGPGLTPSMDDFLSGMMIANLYISHFLGLNLEDAYKLNHEIVRDIDNKTTRVSEEMLKQSSIGETNEDIKGLMINLIARDDKKSPNELLSKIKNYGHSSGTDILCGIFSGSYILMKKNKTSK